MTEKLLGGGSWPGQLWSHYGFETGATGVRRRRLLVYLPASFNPRRRQHVLYLLDGQNAFNLPGAAGGSWHAERALEELLAAKAIPPTILVGVTHSSRRYAEYLGWTDHPDYPRDPASDRFSDYVANTVRLHIEERFKVKASSLVGTSAGGVAALYTAFRYRQLYAGAASLSAGRGFYRILLRDYIPDPLPFPVFLSCGGKGMDREFQEESSEFHEELERRGRCDFHYDAKASHHEKAWSRVVPEAFRFLLTEG